MKKFHYLLDKKSQSDARKYEKENRLLGLFGMVISLIGLLGFYITGISFRLAYIYQGSSLLLTCLIYGGVFFVFFALLNLPLGFYSGYIHEHRWNFSNHTVKSWIWEQMKSFLVGLIIFLILFGLLLWIMTEFPNIWWLIAALALAIVSVIFATLFPIVIFPLFNKYTPIEDQKMTQALEEILNQGGLKSSGFFLEDMSKQTKKENAFLAGLGRTRRVVLGDNLIKNMDLSEIISIIAHEVGHYKYKHIWKNIILGTLQQLSVFYLLHILMTTFFSNFLSTFSSNLHLFPWFVLFFGGISGFLFGPLGNLLSRFFEKQADFYALQNIKDKKAYITALAGLANRNLSNAYPVWWVKVLYYSHPPIGERLEMAENYFS